MSSTCPHNMVNFGPLAAEIGWPVWGTPANYNSFRVLAALLHGSQVVGVSQTLRQWTEGAAYVRQGDHVGHCPTFLVYDDLRWYIGYGSRKLTIIKPRNSYRKQITIIEDIEYAKWANATRCVSWRHFNRSQIETFYTKSVRIVWHAQIVNVQLSHVACIFLLHDRIL